MPFYCTEQQRKMRLRLRLRPETEEEHYRYANDYKVGVGWYVERETTRGTPWADEDTKGDESHHQGVYRTPAHSQSSAESPQAASPLRSTLTSSPTCRRRLLSEFSAEDNGDICAVDAMATERPPGVQCVLDEERSEDAHTHRTRAAAWGKNSTKASVASSKGANGTKDMFYRKRRRLPRTIQLSLTNPQQQTHSSDRVQPTAASTVVSGPVAPSLVPCKWPPEVIILKDHFNPDKIRFDFESPFSGVCGCSAPCGKDPCPYGSDEWCCCPRDCRKKTSPNAILGVYCDATCCDLAGKCGNGLVESEALILGRRRDDSGLGVMATTVIEEGVVIGQYLGHVKAVNKATRVCNSGYTYEMSRSSASHPGKKVVIDAEGGGNITRFLNHSCCASCEFYEVRNGSNHTVVVVTTRDVNPGEEITVNYGSKLWFLCRCGEDTCQHRDIQHKEQL